MTDVYVTVPKPIIKENTAFDATAYFRVGSAASAPATNVQYRVDNISTETQLVDWTSVTPAVSVTISIPSAYNKMQRDSNTWEKMQLTVASDRGQTVATYGTAIWKVENVYGYIKNA